MATSEKEFIVGCLVGGLIGASAALLMPKRFLNGINGVARSTHHATKRNHHRTTAANHTAESFAVRKPRKRAIKHNGKRIARD